MQLLFFNNEAAAEMGWGRYRLGPRGMRIPPFPPFQCIHTPPNLARSPKAAICRREIPSFCTSLNILNSVLLAP